MTRPPDPGPATDAWWARKRMELEYLATFTDTPPSALPDAPPADPVTALLDANRAMRRALRLTAAHGAADLFETAQEPPGARTHRFANAEITYNYQRYDLTRTGTDWLELIHARDAGGRAQGGFLLGSGMSAITALLATLRRAGMTRISVSPWCYFEVHLLLTTYAADVTLEVAEGPALGSDADIAWLDTSSTHWPELPRERGSLRLLVVDTTCVEPDDTLVDAWVERGRELGIPVVLVRSHLKLDTFGVELGRIGSIVVVGPDADAETIAPLVTGIRQAASWMGLGFDLVNLYPWLGEPAFLQLSGARAAGIRATSALIAESLDAARAAGDRYEVIRPAHRLFTLVRTGIAFHEPHTWTLHELAYDLATVLADAGWPVFAGSSFGLDRVVLSQFVDVRDGAHYLRITGADLPPGVLQGIGVPIRDAIAALDAREQAAARAAAG